jgi:hypothetical protein
VRSCQAIIGEGTGRRRILGKNAAPRKHRTVIAAARNGDIRPITYLDVRKAALMQTSGNRIVRMTS